MSQPLDDFKHAVQNAFQNYAAFTGTATRPEYWYFYLFLLLCNVLLEGLGLDLFHSLFILVTITPFVAVGARRLHAVGRSGWWQVLALTIIGLIPLIYWLCQPTGAGDRRLPSA